MNLPRFHAQHHNFTAKRIREVFPMQAGAGEMRTMATIIALNFAEKFAVDNVNFDPLKFLDACSPDDTVYPLSELWEDHLNK